MREILFRGKRLDNGEWVESHGISRGRPDEKSGYKYYLGIGGGAIVGTNEVGNIVRLEAREDCLYCEVDPETVGQCTGLKDKNGKWIFEGDICKVGNLLYKVEFKYSAWWFTILSNKVYCCPAFNSHCGECCEVIGNIHDNPELLEGE